MVVGPQPLGASPTRTLAAQRLVRRSRHLLRPPPLYRRPSLRAVSPLPAITDALRPRPPLYRFIKRPCPKDALVATNAVTEQQALIARLNSAVKHTIACLTSVVAIRPTAADADTCNTDGPLTAEQFA